MHSKYVDDTTAFEIIPRNSISILNLVDEFGYFIATYMCWI